jgi:hypothetical protein
MILNHTSLEIKRQEDDIVQSHERIAILDKQQNYLKKNITESEKNLRELIQKRN